MVQQYNVYRQDMNNDKYDNILNLHQSDEEQNGCQYDSGKAPQIEMNSFGTLRIQINEQIRNQYKPIELVHQSTNSVVVKCQLRTGMHSGSQNQCCPAQSTDNYDGPANPVVVKISKSAKHEAQVYDKLTKIPKSMHFVTMHGYVHDCIVLEYCGGNLRDIIANTQVISNATVFRLLNDCTTGFKSLEQISIIHGDIKPENILHRGNELHDIVFVISDFSSSFPQSQTRTKVLTKECSQTWCYRAPQWSYSNAEIMVGRKIDIWGLGCLLFQCLTGECLLPMEVQNQKQYQKCLTAYATEEQITKRLKRFGLPSQVAIFQQLLLKLLKKNPTQRPSVYELQQLLEKANTLFK